MKRLIYTVVIIFSSLLIQAQQDAMFTHYAFNTLSINPAYAGTRDALTIVGLHRSQWVSFPGAPQTQTLTMHTPFFRNKIGGGLSIVNDKIGPSNVTAFYADFSYKIKVTKKSWLSFGLKGGLNLRKINLTSLKPDEAADPLLLSDVKSALLPNFGFGLYYYTYKYYVGLSIPKLLENDFKTNSVTATPDIGSEKKHYFFIAGAVFKLSDDLLLKPTTFLKVTNGAPIEFDLTANFIIRERVSVGAMYRSGDAAGLLFGVNITPQLLIGYSYDWSFTNSTGRYNGGSHEIMLQYDFIFKDREKVRSPRYF